ncbi:MAG: hypothetical protein FWE10_02625 [Rikenellaceae bacterium]|nr:hypothetical protein [Rikenellaceae bacterium]MCL2692768.1 hypothetical protein [Rikenellaceae bacterium]
MIDIKVRIHDRFSIEFKVGFVVRRKLKDNDFAINTWIFIPNSLDLNPVTYTKPQFYRDVKSNVRLITPKFLLREIVSGNALPLHNLEKAMTALANDPTRTNVGEYEYQIKMFSAIVKSAQRDEIAHIISNKRGNDLDYLVRSYARNVVDITQQYRSLRKIIDVPTVTQEVMNYYTFGDEFLSNIAEQNTYRLIEGLEEMRLPHADAQLITLLKELIRDENRYKRGMGYLVVESDNPANNRDLVFRHGVLKKYINSDLFLISRKKKDGVIAEQFLYSIAAGIAMVVATVVAFWSQLRYGNFTFSFFFALVIGYMFKDRIKEKMRYYFAHTLSRRYFDNKAHIGIKDAEIGWIKEAVDFVTDQKTPPEVMEIRSRSPLLEAENRTLDEKILLYRKLVRIDRESLNANSEYTLSGINDITRLHFTRFVEKTDNPEVSLHKLDEQGNVLIIDGEKGYYINIILQMQFEGQTKYKRYRVSFNRTGITGIEEMR